MKTKDFLLEIGVEELPTQSLLPLSKALQKNLSNNLKNANIAIGESHAYVTPRRLAVLVSEVTETQSTQMIERQGPAEASAFDSDGTPTLACIGFAKSCGVTTEQLEIKQTPKGNRVYCRIEKPGEATLSLLTDIIHQAIDDLPVSKPMRWGEGEVTFVRPVHWILALFGDDVIKVNRYGQHSGNKTYGHRFHAPQAIEITEPGNYANILEKNFVIADFEQRKKRIMSQIKQQEAGCNLKVVIDNNLLDEVNSLIEWPVALIGKYDKNFLKVPAEVLITSMKTHQKCFPVTNNDHKLQAFFLMVSNINSKDPNAVITGNERVIRARLSDAAFFFNSDLAKPLSYFNEKLKEVLFQKGLGTLSDKTDRLAKISREIAKKLDQNEKEAAHAASISKFDLMSDMVDEFPELQGVMGRYYALGAKEPASIANSVREHYYPRFSGDRLPKDTLSCIIALADRLDLVCGIFGINKIPSGEKDPYALRRAAQGIIRILIEKELPLDLIDLITLSVKSYKKPLPNKKTVNQVFQFIMERMRFWYLESGTNTEIFSAVSAKNLTTPLDFHHRLEAVKNFQSLSEAKALSAANKRVNNLLKKSSLNNGVAIDQSLFESDSERQLAKMIDQKSAEINQLYQKRNYAKTLTELALFKDPVDDFFKHVMVMVDDNAVRNNRLSLLKQLHGLLTQVADISCL